MLTKTRRRHWLPAVCAFGVLLPAVALNLRSDRPTTSDHPQKSAPLHERLRYIVQAASADIARSSVRDVGGLVTSDLSVIRAVGAALDNQEALRCEIAGSRSCGFMTIHRCTGLPLREDSRKLITQAKLMPRTCRLAG